MLVVHARATFTDVTLSVGLDEYEKIERDTADFVVRGGSPIVMDFDGNGWLDLYIVRYQLDDLIYLNDGGIFTKVINPLGIETKNGGNVGAWADIDNDGDPDMIVATADAKSHLLYLNNGDGTFVEAAQEHGLDLTSTEEDHQGTAVTVGDVNRDGYLDVIFGDWGVDVTDETRLEHYALLINRGPTNPGYFDNMTEASRYFFGPPRITIFSPTISDLDQDGWPDIPTVVDFGKSALYWNNADGTFTNSTLSSGTGLENHGMGTAIGDIDNDGDLDWWVTTIAITRDSHAEVNPLYINQGGRLFKNVSVEAGVAFGGWGWGTNFFDFDHDEDLDIVMVNQEDETPAGPLDDGKMFLWRNDGNLHFADASTAQNANYLARGAGLVTFDYDNDGDLDIFAVHQNTRPVLLRNNNINNQNYLEISLEGTLSNRDGIGAFITVQNVPDGPIQVREYNPTNAYLAQLSPRVHFGISASTTEIHKITVRWPSSIEQELNDVPINQLLHITEDNSLFVNDSPPVLLETPVDQVLTRGQDTTLSIATERTDNATITWFRNGVLLAGVEGRNLSLANVQPRNAGIYHAVATNSAGSTESAPFIVGVRSDFSDRNIARQWNEAVLDAARINFPDPPIVARTFYHCAAAMWDTFWAYQPNGWGDAQPVFHKEILTEADWEGDRDAALSEALSHAVFTIAYSRYSKAFNHEAIHLALRDLMQELGYDPEDTSTEGNSPAAVGNRIGQNILSTTLEDGSNEENDYADTTGYEPINEPLVYGSTGTTLVDPNRWQPLNLSRSITKNGIDLGAQVQNFLAPGWNWVVPFALQKPTDSTVLIDPGPQPLFGTETEPQYISEAVEVIRASSIMDPEQDVMIDVSPGASGQNNPYLTQDGAGHSINPYTGQPYVENWVNQGDYYRLTAEFWSDGPGIEGPPGVWNMLHNQVTDDPNFERRLGGVGPLLSPLEWDVHAYLALNGALHDAAIAAWTIKSKYDSIRPISMIRYLASLGQSSDPNLPNYNASGLPLEDGLIELITEASSAPGERHSHLSEYVGELATFTWRGVPNDPKNSVSGVGWIRALNWSPYHLRTFPTPNFAGYISGHSTFSRAGAETMSLLTGSPFFPGGLKEFHFDTGKYLQVEYGPSEDLDIQVATYYDAADLTGIARVYCGVHIATDDFVGRKIGARVATDAFLKVLALRENDIDRKQIESPLLKLPYTRNESSTTPLVTYRSEQPLDLQKVASFANLETALKPTLYFRSSGNLIEISGPDASLAEIEVRSLSNHNSVTLEFQLVGSDLSTLLATAFADEKTSGTLFIYKETNGTFELIDSNQDWKKHPRASLASIFTNRRDLAGKELPESALAIPLQASPGTYRIELVTTESSDSTLRLEQVK